MTYAIIRYYPLYEKSYLSVFDPIPELYSQFPVVATGLTHKEAVTLLKILRSSAEES